jgi:chromosome partitioning protein
VDIPKPCGLEIVLMIVAFVSQKGGVGKTTLALHVASELARRGERVTVIDADSQGSALDWAGARARSDRHRRFAVIGLPRETLHLEVSDVARANDHVVIDGPPRSTALTRSAILAADRVVIPVQPSALDVWGCREIVGIVREIQVFKPRLTAAFIANRVVLGTIIARALREPLSRTALRKLAVEVHQRVIFAECLSRGLLASELDPDGRAAEEIRRLADEIRSIRS